jgi:peptidoglycan hydrolase-like protein with peptidoglycan-binding domain
MGGQGNVKQVQEALKDKGFDPGPVDGIMGPKTQEALRSFQQSKNLKATGRVDAQTRKELGVEQGAASTGSSSRSGSTGASDLGTGSSKPSDTGTTGGRSGTSGSGATGSGSRSGTGSGATGSGSTGSGAGSSTGSGGSSSAPSGGAR